MPELRTADCLGKERGIKNYELIHLLQQLPYNYDVVVQYRDDGGYYYGTDSNIVPTADDEKKIIVL